MSAQPADLIELFQSGLVPVHNRPTIAFIHKFWTKLC